jgi:tRNA pseudouridine32 synthase / 23S rRNA pseudouridine746 synthase
MKTEDGRTSPGLPAGCEVHGDDTCVVLDKPAGLLSVPGRGELRHDSLAQRVQTVHPQALVVHRLDMATSGLLLMAKGPHWQRAYSRLFAERGVRKEYVAVVSGWMAQDQGEVDLPLITDWPNRPRQRVDRIAGKPSLTRYAVLARDPLQPRTRLLLQPVTGRTHQLRVHMLALGHPILGDRLYAPDTAQDESPRLLLHAQLLALSHPGSLQDTVWRCPPPF